LHGNPVLNNAENARVAAQAPQVVRVEDFRERRPGQDQAAARPQVREDPGLHGNPVLNNAENAHVAAQAPEPPVVRLEDFSLAEMDAVWKEIPLGKAAGVDGIMGEMLKYGDAACKSLLLAMFNKVLEKGEIPADWTRALVVPIYKNKGSDREAKNYRPIALTCVTRRIFERLLFKRMGNLEDQLSDWQGGFRAQRSTLQAAFVLHEIMLNRPGLQVVLLDLKAAYDSVDRRVLWRMLRERYAADEALCRMLEKLFDGNTTQLVVSGVKSRPIANLRGLLQGSSLSPLLFNLFINALLEELLQAPKVTTSRVSTNVLAFADDLALVAESPRVMAQLLQICQRWSLRVGMQFAPDKCIVLDPDERTNYELYGTPLVRAAKIEYLGIPFTRKGVDLGANATRRAAKAKALASMFAAVGMNLTGFSPDASARVYASFIRPVMEYGTALAPLKEAELRPLQLAQNFSLRAVFSAPRTTSTNACQKLLHIPPMQFRNQALNINFVCSLHNSTDASMPAVKMWWARLPDRKAGSLTTLATAKNPLWAGAQKINHVVNRLQRRKVKPGRGYSKAELDRMALEAIARLDRGDRNIAGAIEMESTDPVRFPLRADFTGTMETRVTVTRWMVGAVVRRDACRNNNCGQVLTRQHALECSGALDLLEPLRPPAHLARPNLNLLDNILNASRALTPPPHFYATIARAIGLIYSRCLRFAQRPNGYWTAENPDPG
jgi:hypothetical protein